MDLLTPQFIQDNAPLFIIVILWDLFWKGIALWYAARRGSKPWFVIILVVNSIGILPIVYLLMTKSLSLAGASAPEDKQ